VLDRRRRVEEVRASALECYAAIALGLGGSELGTGERAARELVERAPYRERGQALLMGLLAARGNPAEALRVYEALRERLRDDLGIAPAPRLRELQAQLLRTGDLVPG
jgi:DNA-binding SARP family transcriptional activator